MADKGKGAATSGESKRKTRASKQVNPPRQEPPVHDNSRFRDKESKVRYNSHFPQRKLKVERFVEYVALQNTGLESHLKKLGWMPVFKL